MADMNAYALSQISKQPIATLCPPAQEMMSEISRITSKHMDPERSTRGMCRHLFPDNDGFPDMKLPPIEDADTVVPRQSKQRRRKKSVVEKARKHEKVRIERRALSVAGWQGGLRHGHEERVELIGTVPVPVLDTGRHVRPFNNLGHGSGWRKDSGHSLSQQWKQFTSDGEHEKRVKNAMRSVKRNNKRQSSLWLSQDGNEATSVLTMANKLEKQNQYLAKQEMELQEKLQKEAMKAIHCRWGSGAVA